MPPLLPDIRSDLLFHLSSNHICVVYAVYRKRSRMAHVHRVVNRHCSSLLHQLGIGRFLNLQLTTYSMFNGKRVVSGRRNGRHGLIFHILHFTAFFGSNAHNLPYLLRRIANKLSFIPYVNRRRGHEGQRGSFLPIIGEQIDATLKQIGRFSTQILCICCFLWLKRTRPCRWTVLKAVCFAAFSSALRVCCRRGRKASRQQTFGDVSARLLEFQ